MNFEILLELDQLEHVEPDQTGLCLVWKCCSTTEFSLNALQHEHNNPDFMKKELFVYLPKKKQLSFMSPRQSLVNHVDKKAGSVGYGLNILEHQ